MALLSIGFGNYVPESVVIALVCPDTAPIKRKIDEAKHNNMLIDATLGRKTRCVIMTKTNHVILSAIQTDTIAKRLEKDNTAGSPDE